MLTSPQNWTPHATYEATRLFVSNLDSNQAQRFLNMFLLDKVRDDISENKKLNYHLYMALKKSLYKPGAFFKGILFPLCQVTPFLIWLMIERQLHTKRSRHNRVSLLKSLNTGPPLRSGPPLPLRNAVYRSQFSHDQSPPR